MFKQLTVLPRICFIRHGETEWSFSGQYASRTDLPLTEHGEDLARFSHGHFGRVLATRWIGLPVNEAQHFLLGTASLSIFDYEHDQTNSPVIALWNAGSGN